MEPRAFRDELSALRSLPPKPSSLGQQLSCHFTVAESAAADIGAYTPCHPSHLLLRMRIAPFELYPAFLCRFGTSRYHAFSYGKQSVFKQEVSNRELLAAYRTLCTERKVTGFYTINA